MKNRFPAGAVVLVSVSAFFLIFRERETAPSTQRRTSNAKSDSGRLGNEGASAGKKGIASLTKSNPALTPEQAAAEKAKLEKIAEAKAAFEAAVAAKDGNAIASRDFLAANSRREGVVTTESGLQYEPLTTVTGPSPGADDKVKVHYHGTLVDGTVFDSSVQRGEPISFPLSGVIPGWQEGVQLMPAGSKFKLFIPPYLAYGATGAGPSIRGHAALVFEVELLDIEPK
jgi:FKBP-type peptidyl-prolyl cis-trans isomerase FklB